MIELVFIVLVCSIAAALCGSYFSVVSARGWRASLFLPSVCDFCDKKLKWYQLVPVFFATYTHLFNKSKTSCCGKNLSRTYLLSEIYSLIFGFFTGLVLLQLPPASWPIFITIALVLFYLAIYDIWNYSINFLYILLLLFILILLTTTGTILPFLTAQNLFENLPAALTYSFLTAGLIILSRGRGLGSGDIGLVYLIGIILGWTGGLVAILIAIYSAAAVGLVLAVANRKFKGLIVPLVPFLVLGLLIATAFSTNIIELYNHLLYS